MGKRRFTQVSTSEDEEEPTRNDAGVRRKGKKLRVEDEEEEEARQKAAGSSRGGDDAGGSSSGGGGNRKEEEEEEPPLEDAKPKGPVLRVSGKGKRKKRHYCSFEYDGNTFELEDPVLLTPEDKKQKPYVAIIKDITQDGVGSMMVTGQWFYRPEEAERKSGGSWEARDTRELFYSFHLDEVPAESVMHRCIVHFVPLNKKLPLRSEHPGFIVQKVYDTVEKKLRKLTDKDYEDNKQHEIDLLVKKTFDHLGDLPDVEPEDAPADDADQSVSKKNLGKKRMHPIDVSRTEGAPGRSDFLTRADTPGGCTEYRAILVKFKALTGDSYRDKWLDKLLQGIKAACCSKEDASAEDKRTGNGASDHNTTGNNSEDSSAGRICWPDDAVPAITALERATHETLGSDFQKYNQKMRQLDFNLKNNVMLARRLLNKELDPVVILNMPPNELKDGLLAEEKKTIEPEESKQLQMTDARCSRCTEKKVGIADIMQAGGHGDRYQMGRRRGKKGAPLNSIRYENATLREENTGKKNVDKNSILKMQHLQRLATWAGGEARIPPLGAFLGACLAAEAETSGIPLDHSTFLCQRCETVLQPGFNCTIRLEKCVNKGRWRKKAIVPCKNSVVYTCHFCSHRNLKWGTAEGHMKNLIASRLGQDSDSNQHCSTDRTHGNSENVLTAKHGVHQDVGEENPLKLEPVSELKSSTPGRAAVTGEILAECPVTPLEKVVNTSQRKRKVSDSIPNKLPVGGNHSAITDSGKGTGGSSKRRKKAWSSLKEITEKSELENARSLSNFAIPFHI